VPNISPRIAGAIGDCLDAGALSRDFAAESARAKACVRVAREELEKAKREERIASSLRQQAEDHMGLAERNLERAIAAEIKAEQHLRSACRRFSGIDHQVSPASAG